MDKPLIKNSVQRPRPSSTFLKLLSVAEITTGTLLLVRSCPTASPARR